MPFYEITYETGTMSVAEYADDAEAEGAIKAHNDRARNGEPGGPIGQPAERIAKVRVYSGHPNDYGMSAEVAKSELSSMIDALTDKDKVVDLTALAQQVRDLAHPMVPKESPFDSEYKMSEDRELDLAFLDAKGSK